MGNCCEAEQNKEEKNLMNPMNMEGPKGEKTIPLHTIVKFQAMIRGYLARKAVRKIYGYQVNMTGLMTRRTDTEIGAEKLNA
jgi:hypothetical protein